MNNKLLNHAIRGQIGRYWYLEAFNHANELAARYKITTERAAAVLAALSPGIKWEVNKRDAEKTLKFWVGIDKRAPQVSTYKANFRKALAILDSAARPLSFFNARTAPKTRAFFLNILLIDAITIDRWMLRAWNIKLATYKDARVKQFKALDRSISQIAAKLNWTKFEVQASIWVSIRGKYE